MMPKSPRIRVHILDTAETPEATAVGEVWEADMVGWARIWRLWDSEKQYLKDSAEFL